MTGILREIRARAETPPADHAEPWEHEVWAEALARDVLVLVERVETLEDAIRDMLRPRDRMDTFPALAEVVEAALQLDRELSEAHSGFDSDGVYERYHAYPSEQRFRDALARFAS